MARAFVSIAVAVALLCSAVLMPGFAAARGVPDLLLSQHDAPPVEVATGAGAADLVQAMAMRRMPISDCAVTDAPVRVTATPPDLVRTYRTCYPPRRDAGTVRRGVDGGDEPH